MRSGSMNMEVKDHWNMDDEGSFQGDCESCGEWTVVQKVLDPFTLEVNEERVERTLCRPCYRQRFEDV